MGLQLELDVIFFVAATASSLLLILLAYILSRRGREADESQQAARRGLSRRISESFPTMLYSEVKQFRRQQPRALECAICLSEFNDDHMLQLLRGCNHAFHVECIGKWLESNTSCPLCRTDLASVAPQSTVVLLGGTMGSTSPGQAEIQVEDSMEAGTRVGEESTGSMRFWTEEEMEKFTLRLPENLRAELMARRLERSETMDRRIFAGFDIDNWAPMVRTWSRRSPLVRGRRGRPRDVPSPLGISSRRRSPVTLGNI